MSAYSGAFGSKAGFNQSGGGYYMIVSSIGAANILSYAGTSGSGGATTVPALTAYSGAENYSTTFGAYKLIKDMGKTVVSSGRAFRKFQAVVPAGQSTGGVTGVAATPGYLTAYLEVSAPNGGGAAGGPANTAGVVLPIVRYA
jgi:hypothetical protein